jgi:predicted metal-dependent hydrolase
MIHSQSKTLFANAIFQQAIAAFNGADFFGAHELFEDLWRVAPEAERLFLQGLVQIAVAFHHESEGNRTGAESVMRRALKNLSGYPDQFARVQLGPLRKSLQEWTQSFGDGAPSPPLPRLIVRSAERSLSGKPGNQKSR